MEYFKINVYLCCWNRCLDKKEHVLKNNVKVKINKDLIRNDLINNSINSKETTTIKK